MSKPRKKTSKQKSESKLKALNSAQALCDEFNDEKIAERLLQESERLSRELSEQEARNLTNQASDQQKKIFERLSQQTQQVRKFFYQMQREKDLNKVPGKARDVENCPLLRATKETGLSKKERIRRMENFQPLLVAQDFILF